MTASIRPVVNARPQARPARARRGICARYVRGGRSDGQRAVVAHMLKALPSNRKTRGSILTSKNSWKTFYSQIEPLASCLEEHAKSLESRSSSMR
ncbi:hypothetical protein EVAR_49326_1 [Eumeta japonica]|uniref:Uncharacterized protein n=1 Tax=Eumeta variegata TaxID=151549 RepID=A0A4C1Y9U9_EUMVA|nr:hypothetical protein EVAR_49326_1 [Eumeta japonica]